MADITDLGAALSPVVGDHGMEIVDLEYRTERSGWVLRLFVDRPGGVTVEDCARVSRDCSVVLDAEQLINRRYRLEVSSPGIERRLRKQEHFEKQVGQRVHVLFREPIDGRRQVTGKLTEVREDAITVEAQDDTVTVGLAHVKRAKLKVF